MQRLNPAMMERYEIKNRRPAAIRAAQFGMGEALLGVADRLIDAGNAAVAPDRRVGVACVPPDGPHAGEGSDPAALLAEQEGLYTLLERGYRGETPVKNEIVVQCVSRVIRDGDALAALAAEPGLALALVDGESEALAAELAPAARLLAARRAAGLPGLAFLCLGERADIGDTVRGALAGLAPDLAPWLAAECAFYPALADGLARRADAAEAAKQCAEMNYADGMLHLAEPYARLTIQAPAAFRERWPLDIAEGAAFADDIAPVLAQKHRLFDAALFAMAAPGWLLGCDTLSDCMKHARLRAFVGHACYDELLGADPEARRRDAAYVIQCFERFENPLTRNGILASARPLLARFARGALPAIRAWAAENFEPPRRLTFALAATIMLYAGARPDGRGVWRVARGRQSEAIHDDPGALAVFATLSHDMPPEALAYAVLADRELWRGANLRDIDGLEQRVALDIANIQRNPAYLPEEP